MTVSPTDQIATGSMNHVATVTTTASPMTKIIPKDTFFIPDENILYSPLTSKILELDENTIQAIVAFKKETATQNQIEHLESIDILVETEELRMPKLKDPTGIVLFPTTNCTEQCTYCYARAGENIKNMPENTAQIAIDYIIKNAKKQGQHEIAIGFHGNGEPFSNFSLMKFAIEYAKKSNLKVNTRVSTNGVINDTMRKWAVENIDNIQLSMDGPEEIQNAQRPLANGEGSFNKVMETIEFFNKQKKTFGIRATITAQSVTKMEEIVNFFTQISPRKKFHLEPLYECGRCSTTHAKAPDYKQFTNELIRLRNIDNGTKIYYSGGNLFQRKFAYCGAVKNNFYITEEGLITTCNEVSTLEDPRANIFIIGSIEKGRIHINKEKRQYLRKRTIDNIAGCTNCFAKYTCAGECPAKVSLETGDIFNTKDLYKCDSNKQAILSEIKQFVTKQKNKSN